MVVTMCVRGSSGSQAGLTTDHCRHMDTQSEISQATQAVGMQLSPSESTTATLCCRLSFLW